MLSFVSPQHLGIKVSVYIPLYKKQSYWKWVPIISDLQKNIWLEIIWTQKLWNSVSGYVSFTEKEREKIYTEKK